jgi:Holliday junction DNA helicase RuvA
MIAWLSGVLRHKAIDSLIIDVGGVGYEVTVPLSTFSRVPETGDPVALHVHTHLREDSLSLFGFSTELEKEVFLLLLGVSGIGPKIALSVLSGLSLDDLLLAIHGSDDSRLCSISGIGKKTAARVCLELKDKVKHLAPLSRSAEQAGAPRSGSVDDAISALVNLGYKRPQAEEAVKRVHQGRPDIATAQLIRESLGELGQR